MCKVSRVFLLCFDFYNEKRFFALLIINAVFFSEARAQDLGFRADLVLSDPWVFNSTWLKRLELSVNSIFSSPNIGSISLLIKLLEGNTDITIDYDYSINGSTFSFGGSSSLNDTAFTFESLQAGVTTSFANGETLEFRVSGDPLGDYILDLSASIPGAFFKQDYTLSRDSIGLWDLDAIFRTNHPSLPTSQLEFSNIFGDDSSVSGIIIPPAAAGVFETSYNVTSSHNFSASQSNISFNATPVPAPLPFLGVGIAFSFAKRLRKRSSLMHTELNTNRDL